MKKRSQEKTDECQHWRRRFYRKEKCLENEKFCEFQKQVGQGLTIKNGLKWFVSVQVEFIKPKVDSSDFVSEPHFRSLCMTIVNVHETEDQLNKVNQKEAYQKEGSGWALSAILHFDYGPLYSAQRF